MQTSEWVELHGISNALTPPEVRDYEEPCSRTPREIALRTVVLQGIVAVGAEVDPAPIIDWYHEQGVWDHVTRDERVFLTQENPTREERLRFCWHQEAEWALLWAIGKVDHLGLPTKCCDTARLVDEIIPALGSDIEPFVSSAQLLQPGLLLAEDDRTYDMWCCAQKALRAGLLPDDLKMSVLYERRYAFEWLDGNQIWDEVTCDA
ncbi:MAG: DUF4272 domain-containing protein [Planctomycetota bacterium]